MKSIFENKKAFITGSSRGIGRAVALELASHGCDILLHYRTNEEAVQKTLSDLEAKGVNVWLYQGDLCDEEQTQKLLNKIVEDHKTLDIYIANAASTSFKAISDLNSNNINKTMDLVVKSFILSVQKLTPLLKGRDSQVLTISGIDTIKYCPGHGLLAAAKAALEVLTKYLEVELASEKIHFKCINPGLVATDSTKFYMGEAFEDVCKQADLITPQEGFVTPEKLAKIIVSLLRPENNWMATNTVYADGGLSFMMPMFGHSNEK